MTAYPVHYTAQRPEKFTRLQLAVRIVAFWAIGLFGLSFATVFLFAYLALPVFATIRLAGNGSRADYAERDGQRVFTALHWFAAICAWAGLVTDRLPTRSPGETVSLVVEGSAHPVGGAAMKRVITGLPSAVVLAVLGWVGAFVWLWAALTILLFERVGEHAFHFLVGVQRWSLRLLVYQASLVDEYPPFSFSDTPALEAASAQTSGASAG